MVADAAVVSHIAFGGPGATLPGRASDVLDGSFEFFKLRHKSLVLTPRPDRRHRDDVFAGDRDGHRQTLPIRPVLKRGQAITTRISR